MTDPDGSDDERRRRNLLVGKKRAKEVQPRKPKSDDERRLVLEQDPYTDKHASGPLAGTLRGTPHEVYCKCSPTRVRRLDNGKVYDLKNWESHQKTCELVTRVKAGARRKPVARPAAEMGSTGIAAFFGPAKKSTASRVDPAGSEKPLLVQTKKLTPADKRLDPRYFSGAGQWPTRLPPPVLVSEEVECQGLHGDGYREYAWQRGTSYLGGVSATDWVRLAHTVFPYKNWDGAVSESDSDSSSDSDVEEDEPMPEKVIRSACSITDLAMHGIKKETNTLAARALWTGYEKKRLHQSLLVAARWNTQPNSGAVYARDCLSVTTNLTGTCSSCTLLARLPGLQMGILRARKKAQLPPGEFTTKWKKKLKHTPRVLSDNSAADVQMHVANPAVLKILSSKAMHGPGGAFLALYQQAQAGDLDDKTSFLAICDQFTDRVRREKDPTGRLMKGIRYSPELGQLAALMRSHGPRSGSQYDLFKDMVGGISQRQLRRRVAKSAIKMVSSELCAGNLEAAVEFGKLMKYDGPWICAGDGTKLRPLLSTSTEYSGEKSAHVVGSTLPLSEVLFKSSEEQSRIISEIDATKSIATQVWMLAIKIPLPNMPLFPIALIPNKGRMKAADNCEQHLKLRQLCADSGLKLLASGADGAKAEVNAQLLMMNVETETRLTYENPFYGVHVSCPVYKDTGPHIATTDMDHAKKGVRNNFLYGTHLLIIGILYLCHSVLMLLLSKVGVPLYIRDIFNPEKQDDGAARRLFVDALFEFLVDSDGNIIDLTFEGFFVLSFIFGELFDAYMKRGMTHIERVTCIFRARHFLNIWRANVKEKDSNNGYTFDFHDTGLTDEEITALKQVPSRPNLDRACEVAWKEAAALASQFCGMEIPELPLKSTDLHPHFRTTTAAPSTPAGEESDSESDSEPLHPPSATDFDLESDNIRVMPQPGPQAIPAEGDTRKLLGKDLTVSQALAHAAHHILTENYLADQVVQDEAELEAIDQELDANPDTPVSGRMLIANLLNPAPTSTVVSMTTIPTFLSHGQPILRRTLVEQRRRHCATTRVHSEQTRKPAINVEYLGGKFSLNHAAHQLKEGIQQSEVLRTDTDFQKARYRRWIAAGRAVEWTVGCRLDVALADLHVPNIRSRGINAITLGSLVVMRSAIRLYLGEVLGIYRYGSVSGKHESFTDAETVDGLSYLSLRVYEQLAPGRNIFQHMVPPERSPGHSLALFTHAPISELVYLLTGAALSNLTHEMYSISAGDVGWERWQALTSNAVYRILDLEGGSDESDDEEEEDYEEPDEGSGSKKRRPKAPRGALKKQKKSSAPTQKSRGGKKSATTAKKTAKKPRTKLRGVAAGKGAKK
ncbi:hypothetical protein FB451DRAFT_1567900 [Mycena latifolia]|nr:hypothetical protein FB451DRAFT_1567900 [Mycena latifolia]